MSATDRQSLSTRTANDTLVSPDARITYMSKSASKRVFRRILKRDRHIFALLAKADSKSPSRLSRRR